MRKRRQLAIGDMVEHRTGTDRYVVTGVDLVCVAREMEGARWTSFCHPEELDVVEPWPGEPDGNRCGCILYETPPSDPVNEGVDCAGPGGKRSGVLPGEPPRGWGFSGEPLIVDEAAGPPGTRTLEQADMDRSAGLWSNQCLRCVHAQGRTHGKYPLCGDGREPQLRGERCSEPCAGHMPSDARDGITTIADDDLEHHLRKMANGASAALKSLGWDVLSPYGKEIGWRVVPPGASRPATAAAGPLDGERAPERTKLDTEGAREMLANAGWTLFRPGTGPDADAEESERMAHSLAERGWAAVFPDGTFAGELPGLLQDETCAHVLAGRGWILVPPDESLPESITERYVEVLRDHGLRAMASDVDIVLAGAMVERGWTVSGGDNPHLSDDLRQELDAAGGQPTAPAAKDLKVEILAHVNSRANRIAQLESDGYTVVAPSELPKPICQRCEDWSEDGQPDPCLWGIGGSVDAAHCEHFRHRWQDVAGHLAGVLAQERPSEPDEGEQPDQDERLSIDEAVGRLTCAGYTIVAPGGPQPEAEQPPGQDEPLTTDQHIAALEARGYVVTTCETAPRASLGPAYPAPPEGLEGCALHAQLDWLRANDLPTGTGGGKKAKTTMVVKLLRHGYYDPATVEDLTGELQWPPGPARCPVVGENGEPCGSETPEDCEHPLP